MPNVQDAAESVVLEYEQAIAGVYAAVGEVARLGMPLARVLVLVQAAYDKAHARLIAAERQAS